MNKHLIYVATHRFFVAAQLRAKLKIVCRDIQIPCRDITKKRLKEECRDIAKIVATEFTESLSDNSKLFHDNT